MLGTQFLTETPGAQRITAPGMAHWSGTGPDGKRCKDCWFKGYHRRTENKHGTPKTSWSAGCEKFHKLTGQHGPNIRGDLRACKYFLGKPAA
jgi:hypothetical protein